MKWCTDFKCFWATNPLQVWCLPGLYYELSFHSVGCEQKAVKQSPPPTASF